MGRLRKLKIKAIHEANKRILEEGTTVTVMGKEYTISWPSGMLKIVGPGINAIYQLTKTSGIDAILFINDIFEKAGKLFMEITGQAWGMNKTLVKELETMIIEKIIKYTLAGKSNFDISNEDKYNNGNGIDEEGNPIELLTINFKKIFNIN